MSPKFDVCRTFHSFILNHRDLCCFSIHKNIWSSIVSEVLFILNVIERWAISLPEVLAFGYHLQWDFVARFQQTWKEVILVMVLMIMQWWHDFMKVHPLPSAPTTGLRAGVPFRHRHGHLWGPSWNNWKREGEYGCFPFAKANNSLKHDANWNCIECTA